MVKDPRLYVIFDHGAEGSVDVSGVRLTFEWWPGPGPVVCLPGLTSHRRAFSALADELSPRIGFLAFDLRGRGDSDKPDGPYGMDQHAQDILAALDVIGITTPVVMAGHSMGAFVTAAFAAKYPERIRAAILIDGGDFRPPDGDPAKLLDEMLAMFIQRLQVSWKSVDDLCAAFEATPLYEGRMDDAARRYFAFDLSGEPGNLRTKACLPGVRLDWEEILTNPSMRKNLKLISSPALLLTAPGGLTGTGDRVITPEIVEDMRTWIKDLTVVDISGENHHTLLTTRAGAAKTARALEHFLQERDLVRT